MSLTRLITPFDSQIKKSDEPLPKDAYVIWTIYGMKGSGKSTLLLNSLSKKEFYKNYFDCIYLISPTASKDKKFDKLINELDEDNRYFSKCDENTLMEIIERIKAFNMNYKKKKEPHNLIILDDCIHALPKSTQKSTLHELVTTCRHLKTCIFITSQKFKCLNPLIRTNADIISFFTSHNEGEKKAFCDEYGINETLLESVCERNTDFLHITFTSGQKKLYDKFDDMENTENQGSP